jgi:hypothetical protein
LVVVFGLYHGLIFLPAILSFVGPKPYTEEQMGQYLKNTVKSNLNLSSPIVSNVQLKNVTQLTQ